MGVIVPVGRLQVATPETMALAIRALTEATDAVDERIEVVAPGIIAASPTVIAAAVAAVATALTDAELRPVKCVRRENGKWVWDKTSAATHYLLKDDTGRWVVRPTVWPVPAATPSFNW